MGAGGYLSAQERRLLGWHCSNLEYANATDLENLSPTQWDQDDAWGFPGAHCLLREVRPLPARARSPARVLPPARLRAPSRLLPPARLLTEVPS